MLDNASYYKDTLNLIDVVRILVDNNVLEQLFEKQKNFHHAFNPQIKAT